MRRPRRSRQPTQPRLHRRRRPVAQSDHLQREGLAVARGDVEGVSLPHEVRAAVCVGLESVPRGIGTAGRHWALLFTNPRVRSAQERSRPVCRGLGLAGGGTVTARVG